MAIHDRFRYLLRSCSGSLPAWRPPDRKPNAAKRPAHRLQTTAYPSIRTSTQGADPDRSYPMCLGDATNRHFWSTSLLLFCSLYDCPTCFLRRVWQAFSEEFRAMGTKHGAHTLWTTDMHVDRMVSTFLTNAFVVATLLSYHLGLCTKIFFGLSSVSVYLLDLSSC
jgi:hypothetical protein